ncbi:MAG: ABC transporter permease [Firmicutes bacterium]|nr:ABC transporter permease [Bacillota bacterium]
MTSTKGRSVPSLGKYWAIFTINLQNRFVYVMDLVWSGLSLVMFVFIFTQLWRVAYGSAGLTNLRGYTLAEVIWYFMFAEAIVLSHPRLTDTIDFEVKQGSIAYGLTKPYSYLLYHYATFLAEVSLRFVINVLIGSLVVMLTIGNPPVTFSGLPNLLLSVLLSSAVQFCLLMAIGLAAFWLEDTRSIYFIYQKFLFLLGGMLLPLELFPRFIQKMAGLLPLRYVVHGPAKMFVKYDSAHWRQLTAGQIGWLLALALIVTGIYRMGVKKLNVNGG